MCTLIAIHRRIPGAPLVIAANRDEYFARPAGGPERRCFPVGLDDSQAQILAPLDVRAGGTWFGLNALGVFGAVTNLACTDPDPERRSRGAVVPLALREPSAERAADVLKALPERAFNPFHCFVADSDRAFLLSYRDVPRVRELEPGVHVVGNRDPHEEAAPKVERVRAEAEVVAALPAERVLDGLAAVCRKHGAPAAGDDAVYESGIGALADTCVHLETYGTRSSALLLLAEDRPRSRFLFAATAPCETEYEDHSNLLFSSESNLFQLPDESGAERLTAPGETAVRSAS